jgi:hypothetical protein
MKRAIPVLASLALVALAAHDASAWVRAGGFGTASGGGGSWSAHGWRGGSASGGDGSWSATGYRGGTASGGGGSWSAHGAYGGSAYGSGGEWHGTGAYGGSYYGGYHPPTTVNYYGSGCGTCGGWAAGAAATGLVAGAALGAAATSASNSANTANAYAAGVAAGQAQAIGAIYGQLPAGCTYSPVGGTTYYQCNGMWLEPAFGANGVYYRSVAVP